MFVKKRKTFRCGTADIPITKETHIYYLIISIET